MFADTGAKDARLFVGSRRFLDDRRCENRSHDRRSSASRQARAATAAATREVARAGLRSTRRSVEPPDRERVALGGSPRLPERVIAAIAEFLARSARDASRFEAERFRRRVITTARMTRNNVPLACSLASARDNGRAIDAKDARCPGPAGRESHLSLRGFSLPSSSDAESIFPQREPRGTRTASKLWAVENEGPAGKLEAAKNADKERERERAGKHTSSIGAGKIEEGSTAN